MPTDTENSLLPGLTAAAHIVNQLRKEYVLCGTLDEISASEAILDAILTRANTYMHGN